MQVYSKVVLESSPEGRNRGLFEHLKGETISGLLFRFVRAMLPSECIAYLVKEFDFLMRHSSIPLVE